jgi:hypothetical protein
MQDPIPTESGEITVIVNANPETAAFLENETRIVDTISSGTSVKWQKAQCEPQSKPNQY